MNFGQIFGEPKETYHGCAAVGSHKLADFAVSPLLYYRRYISREASLPPQTPALAFGDLFHTLALEGEDVFNSRHIILPANAPERPTDRMRNAKKSNESSLERIAWWDSFMIEAKGRIITSKEDSDLAWRMVAAIREKPKTRALFERGKPEVTFRKQMASFPIQSRCDWYDETPDELKRSLIIDVKTIDSLADFDRQFFKFSYYRQAAFYQLVVHATLGMEQYPRLLYVVCEKEEPFQVEMREPDDIALEIGRNEVMKDLTRLKQCYDTGVFPGSPDEVRPVSLPDWKLVNSLGSQ